jgi:stalled ribosome rescue protein Dom34
MEKQIGLWIDHKKAVIVILEDKKEQIKQIQSNLKKNTGLRGGARSKSPYSARYSKGEDQYDRHQMEQLNRYYGEVIENIRDAGSILIFGPGEAKREFEKRLIRERINRKIAAIEAADKLTDRQFAARVRRYFQNRPS